jgi:glycosyltransferase involved in cell wall biosynthesis
MATSSPPGSSPTTPAGPDPQFAVIIPTLQRRELLKRAVDSVLAQTFGDFELIVVDNGSTDGTDEAMAAYGDRIRYVRHLVRGVSGARNTGLRIARAPLVAFLDSDNHWLPDHLATLAEAFARHPTAVLVSTCPGYRITGRQRPCQARLVDASGEPFGVKVGFISCVGARRAAVEAVGAFDERLVAGEDTDLWIRLALRGPICLLRRRTVLKQFTRGGLRERGRKSGAYLDANETNARTVMRDLANREDPAAARIVREAMARLSLIAALRAIGRGDDEAARASLAEACRLRPELSSEAGFVAYRVNFIPARAPLDVLRYFERAQALWPEPGSDTALYLRVRAGLLALRASRVREAGNLLRRSVLPTTPGFVRRMLPFLLGGLRRRLTEAMHSGRDAADLSTGGDVSHDDGAHRDHGPGTERQMVPHDRAQTDEHS